MHDPTKQHPFEVVSHAVFETPMYYVTAWVDADMARDLLLYNREPERGKESTNRKASPVVVNDYAAQMLQDLWSLSPQPVIFSQRDVESMSSEEYEEMIDGQQRLKAIIQASAVRPDINIPLTFCFDAPDGAKWLLDMGKRRQPGDFFRMQGEIDPAYLAKAVKLLYAVNELRPFKSISLWRSVKLSPQEQTKYLGMHPALRQGLDIAKKTRTLFSAHVGAVLFYMVHREFGVFRAQELFRALESGADISIDDARLKVREFISLKSKTHKWDGFEQLAVLITATNAWLSGQGKEYRPLLTFNKLSTTYPQLMSSDQMPKTVIVPGNDPNLDARSLPVPS